MKRLLFAAILGVSLQFSWAAEIVEKQLKIDGDDAPQPHLFLKCGPGNETELPLHTLYVSKISNADQTIWAVNFHETSNYEDVDLIVCENGKAVVVERLFDKIESSLVEQKVLPKVAWDHHYLAVKNITGKLLKCRFYGASHAQQQTIEKAFTISISTASDGVQFAVVAQ